MLEIRIKAQSFKSPDRKWQDALAEAFGRTKIAVNPTQMPGEI